MVLVMQAETSAPASARDRSRSRGPASNRAASIPPMPSRNHTNRNFLTSPGGASLLAVKSKAVAKRASTARPPSKVHFGDKPDEVVLISTTGNLAPLGTRRPPRARDSYAPVSDLPAVTISFNLVMGGSVCCNDGLDEFVGDD